jgi:hypothetical protein
LGRNVVVLHNGQLSDEQRLWVAVLLPGKLCALAGPTASVAAGLTGFDTAQVHIVVSHGTHVHAPAWVKVHESRRFTRADVNPRAAPPRTRVARSIIDAATWSRSPRRAAAILCAGVQQRLTTVDRLMTELDRAGSIRHVGIMRAVLGDIGGGAHTLAEIALGPLAAQAGLPAPRRQAYRPDAEGRPRYLDAEFDLPDGTVLVVEVDGRGHMAVESWLDDSDRQNEVVIDGRPVLRFPSIVLRLDEAKVVRQLRRMLEAHTPT